MLSKKVEQAMNEQLGFELRSAYAYLAMSAWCERESLPGFAHWLRIQYEEELAHALKFYGYIVDRGGKIVFGELGKPKQSFSGPMEVFGESLENERAVTQAINELYTLTTKEQDYASQAFLNWFVVEQVEEEKSVGDIIDSLKMVGSSGEALYLLDKDLGSRTGGDDD
jgi:ferritin